MSSDNDGTTAGPIAYNLPEWMAISAFTAIAWYSVLQLNVSVFLTFKRRRGLYFWSLLISSYGVIFHSVGFLIKLFALTNNEYLSITIITIGWYPMVTGQALVLYSRLHLVVKEQKILTGVLTMIIWNAITLHIPTTVFTYGSNSADWQAFLAGFNVMERIQMTIFSVQELIISSIYLWAAFRLLKPVYRRRIRSVMLQLLWINFIMVAMDISILAMEYQGNYAVEATLKSMIYAVKLVLEFAVLNQLMRLANSSRTNQEVGQGSVTNAQESHKHDDEEAQRMTRPRGMSHKYLRYGRRGSAASSPNKKPRRISSVAKQGDLPDSPRGLSGLFSARTNESNNRAGLPHLVLDMEDEKWAEGSPTTIITNPAAFAPERRRPTDPFSLDYCDSPAVSPHDVTGEPKELFQNVPHSFFDIPGDQPPRRPSSHLRSVDALSNVLTPTHEEGEGDTAPDPGLLRPRRLSVEDWAPDEDVESGELEVELGANAVLPLNDDGPASHSEPKRSSGIREADAGATPPWLTAVGDEPVGPEPKAPKISHPREPAPVARAPSTPRLDFVTSAL